MDWNQVFKTVATGAAIAAEGMALKRSFDIVQEWLQLDAASAREEIAAFVRSSSKAEIDALDGVLLECGLAPFDMDLRRTLAKHYAFFKIAEYARFGTFRGFPGD